MVSTESESERSCGAVRSFVEEDKDERGRLFCQQFWALLKIGPGPRLERVCPVVGGSSHLGDGGEDAIASKGSDGDIGWVQLLGARIAGDIAPQDDPLVGSELV